MQQTLIGIPVDSLERAYDKLHSWFFAYPDKEFTLNELCAHVGVSKTSAHIVVSSLVREGFIDRTILGNVWRIRANRNHAYFTTRKIPFNLKQVYELGVLNWIDKNIPQAKAVILFGSYRKGDDLPQSDVDIAVEVAGKESLKIIPLTVKKIGYRTNVPLNIHVFSRKNIDPNLFANIANGIVLKGFLEVRL